MCSSGTFVHGDKILLPLHAVTQVSSHTTDARLSALSTHSECAPPDPRTQGEYVVVPTTFRPGEYAGSFRLVVSTDPTMHFALEPIFTHNAPPAARPVSAQQRLVPGYPSSRHAGNGGGIFSNPLRPASARPQTSLQPPSAALSVDEEDQIAIAVAMSLSEQ